MKRHHPHSCSEETNLDVICKPLQCHRVPVAELLNCESNTECTQVRRENEMVFDIAFVITDSKHVEFNEPEKLTVSNVGTVSEQLAPIAHLNRI